MVPYKEEMEFHVCYYIEYYMICKLNLKKKRNMRLNKDDVITVLTMLYSNADSAGSHDNISLLLHLKISKCIHPIYFSHQDSPAKR